jgi:hypothetical protein
MLDRTAGCYRQNSRMLQTEQPDVTDTTDSDLCYVLLQITQHNTTQHKHNCTVTQGQLQIILRLSLALP